MADLVVFGAGQIAEVATVYLERHCEHRIVAYTVDGAFQKESSFAGRPVVPWERLHETHPPGSVLLMGPLSYRRMNEFRRDRYLEGKTRGYRFHTFIHPACHVYTAAIGENCFILENNTIQPFASVGNNTIIWSNNHIGHHTSIGDHCFISSHVGIGGAASIGERSFLAGQCGVIDRIVVGAGCFLGPGTMTIKNLPAGSVLPGVQSAAAGYSSSRLRRLV